MANKLEAQMRVDSPLGPLTLAATARGLALAWFDLQAHRTETVDAPVDEQHPHLVLAARELQAYWAAPKRGFTVPLDPAGTPFQQAVWQVLRGIAPRRAAELWRGGAGHPQTRCGACRGRGHRPQPAGHHRALPPRGGQGNGSLTGYAGGLPRKQALLVLEGALLT